MSTPDGGWGGRHPDDRNAQPDGGQTGWGVQDPGARGAWGGQGAAGWSRPYDPPAPSPGPVPVRPMGLGELLDAAFKLLRADFGRYLLAVGAVVVPTQVLLTLLSANLVTDLFASIESNPEVFDQLLSDVGAALPGFVLVSVLSSVLLLLAQAAAVRIGAARYLGDSEAPGSALRAAGGRALALVGSRFLAGLAAAIGPLLGVALAVGGFVADLEALGIVGIVLTLGLIVLGVYLYVRFALSLPVVVLEGAGPVGSLRRSAQLVRGRWWPIFGTIIVASIVVGIVGTAVSGVFSAVGGILPGTWYGWVLTGFGAILAALATEPVLALVGFLLYADARIRKEGFDLALGSGAAGAALTTAPGSSGSAWTPGPSAG